MRGRMHPDGDWAVRWRWALLAVFLLAFLVGLGGCQTAPKTVLVPVQVPCKVDVPKAPVWATEGLPADASIWQQVKALLAERQQRIAYDGQLLAAIEACQAPAPSPTKE